MGMVVRTNTMALNAFRQLGMNNSQVSKSLEKLASGFRINRAGDDAAGLAISEKMKAQIKGLETASANAQDGISLIQTAEGNLTEVHDMLNRMVELAGKSANGTYTSTERQALQDEMDQLLDEIDRISQSANFNGTNLLDGSLEAKYTNTVANIDDADLTVVAEGQKGVEAQAGVLSFDLSQVKLTSDGQGDGALTFTVAGQTFKQAGTADDVDLTNALTNNGELDGAAIANLVNGSEITIDGAKYTVAANGAKITLTGEAAPTQTPAAAYNVALSATNSTGNNGQQIAVTVEKQPLSAAAARMYGQAEFSLTTDIVKDGGVLQIGDTAYTFAIGKDSKFAGAENVIDLTDLDANTAEATLLRTAGDRLSKAAVGNKNFFVGTDKADATKIRLTEKEGGVDYAKNNLAGADGEGNAAQDDATAADWAGLVKVGTSTASGKGLVLQIGDTAEKFNKMEVSIKDMSSKGLGLEALKGVGIMSEENASDAINTIKTAINSVSTTRAGLGALQNRLEHTINNLDVAVENMSSANSRIRDTDMAKEMMNYTKMNVLVQSAQAMLAQANQQPQSVLQLLQ